MAEDILIDIDVNSKDLNKLNSEVNSLNKNLEQTNEQFEKNTKTNEKLATSKKKVLNETQKLRQELKQAKSDMLASEEGTKQYANALARAASAQQKLKEVNDKTKLAIKDFGDTAKNLAGGIAGISGGFTAAQGVISLFGIESENTAQALLKIQSALAVTQGLATFADSIDSLRDLYEGLKASFQMSKADVGGVAEAVTELSTATENAGDGMEKIAKESAVIGSNVAGVQNVKDGFDDLNKSIETSKLSLQEYFEEIDKLPDTDEGEKKFQDLLNSMPVETKQQLELSVANDELLRKEVKGSIVEIEATKKKIENIKSEQYILNETAKRTENLAKANEKAAESTKKLGSGIGGAVKNMLGMIGQMVIWTAVIGGVIWAISALIEKLNEIPKELEVKLKLEDEAFKNMADKLTKARQLQYDLNLAFKKGDKEKLDALIEYGRKEGILHQTQIDNIKKRGSVRRQDLQEYLNEAKDVEFNLARIREGSELEYKGRKAESQRDRVKETIISKLKEENYSEKEIQKIVNKLQKGELSSIFSESFSFEIGNLVSKFYELNEVIVKNNEDLKVLKKIDLKDVYTLKPEKKTGGANINANGGGASSFVAKPTKLKPLGDNETSNLPSIEQQKNYVKEQKALMQVNMNDAVGYGEILGTTLKASRLTYLKNLNSIAEARQSDLFDEREDLQKKIETQTTYNKFQKTLLTGYLENVNESYASKKELDSTYVKDLNKINEKILKLEKEKIRISKSLKKDATDDEKNANAIQLSNIQKQIDTQKSGFQNKNEAYAANLEELKNLSASRKDLETQIENNAKQGADISGLQSRLQQVNASIVENTKNNADIVRDIWLENLQLIQNRLESVGNSFNNLSQMSSANMQTIENNFAHKKNMMELDTAYTQASSEEQAQMMYKLEKEKYEVMKVEFERKKAFDIGVVAVGTAKSMFGVVENLIARGGFSNPLAVGLAAVETATVLTSGAAQINEIKSRKLEQPVPPSSGGGKGGGGAVVALTPNQNSLTSKEENLNMMNKSNLDKMPTPVVKVSEINEVQNKVKVQETNSKL